MDSINAIGWKSAKLDNIRHDYISLVVQGRHLATLLHAYQRIELEAEQLMSDIDRTSVVFFVCKTAGYPSTD